MRFGTEDIFYSILLIILIGFSAFFSASETALMRSNRVRIRHMAEQGKHDARRLATILKEPDRLLSTILVGNNFVNVLSSALATAILIAFFGERGILYATILMTVILLLFGEIIPKTMAAYKADDISLLVASPLKWIIVILSPVVRSFNLISRSIVSLLGVDMSKVDHITEEDIGSAIFLGHMDGFIQEPKAKMLLSIMDMDSLPVRKAMIPIHDVEALAIDTPFEKIVETAVTKNYSRYPVYEGTHGNILGYFHIRDAWQYIDKREKFTIKDCLREAHFVPETKSILKQLIDFQQMRVHMAFVVDEYGSVKGVVTLEDMIEEITGDISDEHDAVLASIVPIGAHSFLVQGNIALRDLGRSMDRGFPEDVDTLSGLIYAVLDRIPEEGETVTWEDLRLKVERMRGNRIARVRITLP